MQPEVAQPVEHIAHQVATVTWVDLGIFSIAIVAAILSLWAIISNRFLAQRQETLKLIAESEADLEMAEAKRTFIRLANKDGGLGQYGELDRMDGNEAMAIRMVLNELELISIGIQRGILDFSFVERWNKNVIISYYDHALPFITRIRNVTGKDTYYQEVEALYTWMSGKAAPKRRRFWWLLF